MTTRICTKQLLIILMGTILFSCKEKLDIPSSNTVGAKAPGPFTVKVFGSIFGREITSKGFCWDTLKDPDFDKNMVDLGSGSQSYSFEITGLKPSKTYYVRAFATNASGTAFGESAVFTTVTPPQITTGMPSVASYSSASLSAYATSSSTLSLLDCGVCYGTTHNPDLSNFKKSGGSTLNYFTTVTNLTENTTYYVRAYATYYFGTVYGNEQTFVTPSAPVQYSVNGSFTDNEGNTYHTVTIGNQTWMAENLVVSQYYSGGSIPLVGGGGGTWNNTSFGARCNYADNTGYTSGYGYMYNYRAILDPQGIAPSGWHIPTSAEWQTLIDKLGGNSQAMQHFMINDGSWYNAYCSPTNYSAMSLKSCGYRTSGGGDSEISMSVYYWTSDYIGSSASAFKFSYNCGISKQSLNLNSGCYIRCIKD